MTAVMVHEEKKGNFTKVWCGVVRCCPRIYFRNSSIIKSEVAKFARSGLVERLVLVGFRRQRFLLATI